MSDFNEPRSSMALTLGAKIAVLAAVPFLALAAYFLLSPISDVRTDSGAVFDCGSALKPPTDGFQKGVCQNINSQYKMKGFTAAGAGVVVAGLGVALFGAGRQEERPQVSRRVRPDAPQE